MKTKQLCALLVFLSLLSTHPPLAWGGQVVTDEAKSRAAKALDEEKSLQAPPAPNSVAVLYFNNLSRRPELDPLQKGLTIMLITDLSKIKSLNVLERVRLQALLEEMKLGSSGLVDQDSAPRVGKLLGAYWLVGGDLAATGAVQLQMKGDVLVVPTSTVAGEPSAEGVLEDIFRMEKDLLFGTIKLLKIQTTPAEDEELKKPVFKSIKALLDFAHGVEMSDKQDYAQAAKYYEMALSEEPGLPLAIDALKELKSMGLLGGTNRSRDLLRSLKDGTSNTNQLSPSAPTKRERTPRDIGGRRPG